MRRNAGRTLLGALLTLGLAVSGTGMTEAQAANVSSEDVTLTAVDVIYHTNNDDKDHNTKVFTTVRDNRGIEVATLDEHFGSDTWDDDEDDGPYGLRLTSPATWASMKGGQLVVRIEPDGRDTWKFNAQATLFFSDGERRHAVARNHFLDQNLRQIEIEII
ncbi:hypothetical protein ACRYCC_10810 [Actinomadura scrupuli]|uniref:hypothetical protein n=1 Tax=Actinomadura scrupuli TaxID=559629 RepID=UPI003D990400